MQFSFKGSALNPLQSTHPCGPESRQQRNRSGKRDFFTASGDEGGGYYWGNFKCFWLEFEAVMFTFCPFWNILFFNHLVRRIDLERINDTGGFVGNRRGHWGHKG